MRRIRSIGYPGHRVAVVIGVVVVLSLTAGAMALAAERHAGGSPSSEQFVNVRRDDSTVATARVPVSQGVTSPSSDGAISTMTVPGSTTVVVSPGRLAPCVATDETTTTACGPQNPVPAPTPKRCGDPRSGWPTTTMCSLDQEGTMEPNPPSVPDTPISTPCFVLGTSSIPGKNCL